MQNLDFLQMARYALKHGQRVDARNYAWRALQGDEHLEEAWLILAAVASPEASVEYLQKALQINPQSIRAQKGMEWAEERLKCWNATHSPKVIPRPLVNDVIPIPAGSNSTGSKKKPAAAIDPALVLPDEFGGKPLQEQRMGGVTALRTFRYVFTRLITILLTIAVGVFATIMIANRDGSLDQALLSDAKSQASIIIRETGYEGDFNQAVSQLTEELVDMRGGNLPPFLKHLSWLKNILTFNWGDALASDYQGTVMSPAAWKKMAYSGLNAVTYHKDSEALTRRQALSAGSQINFKVSQIIITRLPNTLLIVGSANLLLFLIGIPLALHISTRSEKFLDKLVVALAPLSSIPSWVHGIILVMLFAVTLRILPYGRMFDVFPPSTPLGYIPIVLKHMILPVMAIFLSIFFQCVYAWRTYCLLYSMEDYVDLAKAKGLSAQKLERKYILRPSMPYILTSFALTFLSFWQTTTALEYFFDWPGIGQLYIESIKQFDSIVVIAIVAIFAYLLGVMVFLLDIFYVLLDPRIQIQQAALKISTSIKEFFSKSKNGNTSGDTHQLPGFRSISFQERVTTAVRNYFMSRKYSSSGIERQKDSKFKQMFRYPSAMIGLSILAVLILLSIYVLITMPYKQIEYSLDTQMEIKKYNPIYAQPAWFNLFRADKLPETIIVKTSQNPGSRVVSPMPGGGEQIDLALSFEYPYSDMPQSFKLYFTVDHATQKLIASVSIETPDGRIIPFKGQSIQDAARYDFDNTAYSSFINTHALGANIKIGTEEIHQTESSGNYPVYYLIMTHPDATKPLAQKGRYTLNVSALTFEPNVSVDAELVVKGKVFGLAGTDNLGNELLTPLLQGTPIAIGIGIIGALVTTVLSLLLAALGAWFGGWLDTIIQRISEATMILPILAICVLLVALFDMPLWGMILIIIILNAFGSPIKAFRAAFLQVKSAPYIEAARAYGASNWRIITRYIIPRIMPVLFPQLILLIPAYVFLEATLAIFGVNIYYATWGSMIYNALKAGSWQQAYYWVFEPIMFLLVTGLAFALIGSALDRIYNPRLQQKA